MKKNFLKFIPGVLFIFFLSAKCSFAQLPAGIFQDSVFANVNIVSDILYGSNFNHSTMISEDLYLDTYVADDSLNYLHPLLIYIHGGGFTAGDKTTDKALDYGDYFAKRGYLVASINYRLSINISGTTNDNYQMVFQAVQDANAAVRYFKKNANEFCLDTAAIFLTGTSAGGSTTAMSAYWDQMEVDQSIVDSLVYGNLFTGSGNPGYSNNIAGAIICWGATTDTTWFKNETTPNLIFHGTADPVIPFTSGYNIDSVYLYGGKSMYQASIDYGIESTLHPFYGAGHGVPKNSPQFDTIFMMTTDFMISHMPATTGLKCNFGDAVAEPDFLQSVIVFPNPTSGKIILSNEVSGNNSPLSISIYNSVGIRLSTALVENSVPGVKQLDYSAFENGIYFLHITSGKQSSVVKLLIQKN